MQHIARLLDIPGQSGPPSPAFVGSGLNTARGITRTSRESRPLFNVSKVPGFAAPRREPLPGVVHRADESRFRRSGESPNRLVAVRREEGSSAGRKDGANRLEDVFFEKKIAYVVNSFPFVLES